MFVRLAIMPPLNCYKALKNAAVYRLRADSVLFRRIFLRRYLFRHNRPDGGNATRLPDPVVHYTNGQQDLSCFHRPGSGAGFRHTLFSRSSISVLETNGAQRAIALAFLGSQFIGDKTFVQRMMQNAAQLTPAQWRRLNSIWVVFFAAVGCINLYVAFAFSEATWVKFKLFGMFGITIIFVIIQTVWLSMTIKENESADQRSES